jgi:hypothetical protein
MNTKLKEPTDWIVTTYNKSDKILKSWLIQDRTEHEAENESASEVNKKGVDDWTMMPIEDAVSFYVDKHGVKDTHPDFKRLRVYLPHIQRALSGYVLVKKFKRWIPITPIFEGFDQRDEIISHYIAKTYCGLTEAELKS